jgi:hypothetical protein
VCLSQSAALVVVLPQLLDSRVQVDAAAAAAAAAASTSGYWAGQGKARQGRAGQGKARQGKARQGKARQGIYQKGAGCVHRGVDVHVHISSMTAKQHTQQNLGASVQPGDDGAKVKFNQKHIKTCTYNINPLDTFTIDTKCLCQRT